MAFEFSFDQIALPVMESDLLEALDEKRSEALLPETEDGDDCPVPEEMVVSCVGFGRLAAPRAVILLLLAILSDDRHRVRILNGFHWWKFPPVRDAAI
jgi:hypothetical protein